MPWNKGKKLSLETRVRMSLAKQGRTYSRTTRGSMSRAHLSLSHSPVRHTAFSSEYGFCGAASPPAIALALWGCSWGASDSTCMNGQKGRQYLHEGAEGKDVIDSCSVFKKYRWMSRQLAGMKDRKAR